MQEYRTDILVMGAGTAGIPAALFASEGERRVVLVDAADRIGGTLHVSSGHMSAAASRLQKSRGIIDNAADHFDDVMRISRGTAHAPLVRIAVNNAADTIDWLMENNFDMAPECPVIAYSHEPYLVPRTYWGRNKALSILDVLQRLLEKRVAEGGIELKLNTRVIGVERPSGVGGLWSAICRDPKGETRILAKDVVLATGGYGANSALFSKLTGGLPLLSPAPASADGSGLEMALALGGTVRNESIFLPTLGGVPATPGGHWLDWDDKAILTPQHRQPWEIYVNAMGERFVAEDNPSPDSRERALKQQPGLAFWLVYDARIRREAPPLFPRRDAAAMDAYFNTHPAYKTAPTIAALASSCGMESAKLAASIADYNRGVAAGKDSLGRSHNPVPLEEAPFYAIRHQGVTLRCWAGLGVDEALTVTDRTGQPLPGLYAIGEILGGAALSGDSFASGMSITPALTFGRLLGQRLATGPVEEMKRSDHHAAA